MYAYFDIENLSSFVKSSAKEKFADCNRMLKTHFDIKFNFPKKKMLEYPELMPWITSMTQGAKGSVDYLDDRVYPPRPLKSNTHKDFDKEHLSAVYLLNDERIGNIMNNGAIMYAGVGQEVDVLSSLIKDDDYGFEKEFQVRHLKNWNALDDHITPTTDIIVVDQYIFSDDNIYDYNIYALLERLCHKVRNSSVNIIIFTLPSNYNRISKFEFTPDWGAIRAKIKSIIKRITGLDPKVTFVLPRRLEEHDRTVFTNYQYLVSGDTLNYFDSQWRVITNGRFLRIESAAHTDHYAAAMAFIDDMQAIINETKRLNPDSIKYDKSSYYLNFD